MITTAVVSSIQIQLALRSLSNCLLFRFDESIFKTSMSIKQISLKVQGKQNTNHFTRRQSSI